MLYEVITNGGRRDQQPPQLAVVCGNADRLRGRVAHLARDDEQLIEVLGSELRSGQRQIGERRHDREERRLRNNFV